MAEWVALRSKLEVCDRYTDYEGEGRLFDPWWRQTADQKQLSTTLEEILVAERAQCRESGRCDDDGGGGEVAESSLGSEGPQYAGTKTGDTRVGK